MLNDGEIEEVKRALREFAFIQNIGFEFKE